MADSLAVPTTTLDALARGETIVAITDRNAVNLNDELELETEDARPGEMVALVVAVQPAASVGDAIADGDSTEDGAPSGDAVLLRVFAGPNPVLTDEAFAARRAEVEAQWK